MIELCTGAQQYLAPPESTRPRRTRRRSARTPAPDLEQDRWKRRFGLFDRARALENQIVWVSTNQSGQFGTLRFVASA
jgi:predicted amidohydrolase